VGKKKEKMKIAILGAGLAGLEIGRKLKELGKDFFILEKETEIGGLCRTNKTGEYYWDFAVHAIYSRNVEAMDYFHSLPLDYEYLDRDVKIFHSGSDGKKYIIGYPFEIGIKDLPFNDKMECINGYLGARAKHNRSFPNLEEWINNALGAGIAKHFMIPYNNKIWSCKLSEISERLVKSKIEPASAIDFLSSALFKNKVGRAYQAKFIYPRQGIQQLIDYTARDIKENILLNVDVKKLSRHKKKWTILADNGMEKEADIVISTIPLVEFLKKVDLDGLRKEYDVFKWNNTFFVMIGLKREYGFQLVKDCHWVFFKEDEIFYRATLMHNFSSEYLPVLVAEVTQKNNLRNKTQEEIKNLVIKDLIRVGILDSVEQIARTDIKLVDYTYPIPTVGLEQIKKNISDALKTNNIFLFGRNGNWDYINMDGVILNAQKFITENF